MAFIIQNLKFIGGKGDQPPGGGIYSYTSITDSLATVKGSGYFGETSSPLIDGDWIIVHASDAWAVLSFNTTNNALTVESAFDSASAIGWTPGLGTFSGAGALPIATSTTHWTTTGADAGTLADGTAVGQILIITLVVDGGTGTLTPANGLGYSTIAFADAGDSVTLQWTAGGWAVTGQGGLGTGPLVA